MQRKTNSNTIPFAACIGFLALAAMAFNLWIGGLLFAVAIAILLLGVFSKPKEPSRPLPVQRTIVSEFEALENQSYEQPQQTWSPPQPVRASQDKCQILLTALRERSLSTKAAVLFASDDKPLTVREIIVELASIMEERGDDFPAMAAALPGLYDLLWDYGVEGIEQYSDLAGIRNYIATSVRAKYQLNNVER